MVKWLVLGALQLILNVILVLAILSNRDPSLQGLLIVVCAVLALSWGASFGQSLRMR